MFLTEKENLYIKLSIQKAIDEKEDLVNLIIRYEDNSYLSTKVEDKELDELNFLKELYAKIENSAQYYQIKSNCN